jgi:hypothetical protein
MSGLPVSSQVRLRRATCSKRYATVPGTSVRLLTQTTKMPGPSWSLPAHKACPRAAGSICDSYVFQCDRHAPKIKSGCDCACCTEVARLAPYRAAMVSGAKA